jgi:hypothetical protein
LGAPASIGARRAGVDLVCSSEQVPARNKGLIRRLETKSSLRLEEDEMKKAITVAAIIAAFVAPAFAASEYYVVQDVKTKKCTIIDKKPTDESKAFVNAAGTVYRTRSEAAIGMTSVKVCKSD